jgi:RND family efflux transporter MFP subunit
MTLRLFSLIAILVWAGASSMALAQEASLVRVDTVRAEPLTQTVPVIGRIVTRQSGSVATRIGGAVAEYFVEVGDRVAEGDPIARLDSALLEAQLALVEGERREAEANLVAFQAALQLAQQEHDRYEGLQGTQAYSKARYEDAVQNVARAKAEIARAEAQIASKEAALSLERLNLQYARILAPFDGIITRRMAEAGSYVSTGDPLVHIMSDVDLEIEADVPSQRLASMQKGTLVGITLEDGSRYSAVVRAMLPIENPLTRTRPVRFTPDFSGEHAPLADAQSVVVNVPVGAGREVLTIHKDAIIQRVGEAVVFVVVDGVVEQRTVELGEATGTRIEVVSGVSEGEQVVVRGNERLQEGVSVRVDTSS